MNTISKPQIKGRHDDGVVYRGRVRFIRSYSRGSTAKVNLLIMIIYYVH